MAAQRYAEFLRARGQIVAFDPSWDPKGWGEQTRRQTLDLLSAVDVYLPNDTELMHLTGQTSWEAALDVVAGIAGETILKRGADGAVYARSQERIAVPGFPVDAVNTVGAGDVFDAAYLYGRRMGWSPTDRLTFACAVAAMVVSQTGERIYPDPASVMRFVQEGHHAARHDA